MKTHDRLGRRLFTTHTKNPIKNYQPDARQLRWMKFLNVHGMASSYYLHEQTSNTHACRQTSLRRLRDLFDGQMIYRPRQQRETEGADAHHHVYALTERGFRYLKHEGLWVDAIKPSGPWVHQFMITCITSSIDILARREGHRFIPGHEITNDLAVEVPFTWGKGKHSCLLIPDSLFAIQYGTGFIAYLVEADRNTEPNDPKTPHRKSARRMIKQYAGFIGGKAYKQAYGLNCPLVVLNVSVSNTHIDHVMKIVGEEVGACKYLTFTTAPEFRTPFKVPRRLLTSTTKGKRCGFGEFEIIKKHAD
ncbi:MAG: replication-relaxation family protein [Pseudomonadota bacterium]